MEVASLTLNNGMFSSESDEWTTPLNLFRELNLEFNFDLDVCASNENAKCLKYFTKEDDAIKQIWTGNVFLNPPYSKFERACKGNCNKKICKKRGYHLKQDKYGQYNFIKKAYESVFIDKTANLVVALIPSRTDVRQFFNYIWDSKTHRPKKGVQIRFIEGRLKFNDGDGVAPFPSMLVIYKRED